MTTPAQWELGGEIIKQGTEHASLAAVCAAYADVLKSLLETRTSAEGLRRVGAGRTEDPALIVANIVPSLRELAETASLVASQLEERLS